MKVPVDAIGDEGLDVEETLSQTWLRDLLGPDSLYQPSQDGHLSAHVQRADDVVHVHGRARVDLTAACVRCLNPVPLHFNTTVDVSMFPRGEEPQASPDGELTED